MQGVYICFSPCHFVPILISVNMTGTLCMNLSLKSSCQLILYNFLPLARLHTIERVPLPSTLDIFQSLLTLRGHRLIIRIRGVGGIISIRGAATLRSWLIVCPKNFICWCWFILKLGFSFFWCNLLIHLMINKVWLKL